MLDRLGAMTETIDVIVQSVTDEAEAIRSYVLMRADGGPLPGFTAGAHIDVLTPAGALRQYSLLNDERETARYVIAVQREAAGRGGSASMHGVVAGTVLRISAPRNAFALRDDPAPVVLLAGGIGVTPILAMAHSLDARGRAFAFHFATRSAARTPFLDQIGAAPFADRVQIYHDDHATRRFDIVGFVDQLPPGAHLYMCGPAGFMAAVSEHAVTARADVVLHQEYFAAPVAEAGTDADGKFTLELARSGITTTVPAGQSILELLQSHGIECPTSCEEGICGTCLTTVLSGAIDHRDHVLSPAERALGDRMLVCVSRGKPGETLVLDL
ncbi:MAG: PDR/VanB family oxidoreductase [Paracoccus sp. (in: a-proteobacteria)]|nr:PDR/VanB family oxidoreductase [Paracoccus sp. (in: a-proteobacteria)]